MQDKGKKDLEKLTNEQLSTMFTPLPRRETDPMERRITGMLKMHPPSTLLSSVPLTLVTLLAQTPTPGPIHDFVPKENRAQLLQAHHIDQRYEVVLSKTDLPPVPQPKSQVGWVTRQHVRFAPGIEVRLEADSVSSTPYLLLTQIKGGIKQEQRITFERFFLDHELWQRTPQQVQGLKDALQQSTVSPSAYEFFGLARAHGKVYVGVVWYSLALSGNPRQQGLVFRLDRMGKQIKPTPVRKAAGNGFLSYRDLSRPPLLDSLPGGDVILMDEVGLWRLKAKSGWRKLPRPALKDFDAADSDELFLRGRWLLAQKTRQSPLPDNSATSATFHRGATITVLDVLSGNPVRYSSPPLVEAARRNDWAAVRKLLAKRVNVDVKDDQGMTALMHAAAAGHQAVTRLLLERGAKVDARRMGAETALYLAARAGHTAIVDMLLQRGAHTEIMDVGGRTPLMSAADGGHTATVSVLIAGGARINAKNSWSFTPLMYAAGRGGNAATVQALLRAGADVNVRSAEGQTPLMLAAQAGDEAVVRLLLGKGADRSARDDGGWTALRYAEEGRRSAVVSLLREAGARQ